jgi:hypothetical protein
LVIKEICLAWPSLVMLLMVAKRSWPMTSKTSCPPGPISEIRVP